MPTSLLPPPRRPALRVFICDDDSVFAQELAGALAGKDREIRIRTGTDSPVCAYDTFRPHIVLLDIYMPPPDGFELMDYIAGGPRRRDVSLVLLSGAETPILEMAARFCLARALRLAAALVKPVRLCDIERICVARGRAPRE